MSAQARLHACESIIEHATQFGANGIVGLSYDASDVAGQQAATEVICYGTAVVLTKV